MEKWKLEKQKITLKPKHKFINTSIIPHYEYNVLVYVNKKYVLTYRDLMEKPKREHLNKIKKQVKDLMQTLIFIERSNLNTFFYCDRIHMEWQGKIYDAMIREKKVQNV